MSRLARIGQALDAAVLALAPERGRARLEARRKAMQLAVYGGAATGRLQSWKQTKGSADANLLTTGDLATMRDRCREIVRDDPHAASMIRVLGDNIVGTGLRAQSRATEEETGLTSKQIVEWNDACDRVFDRWARDDADSTGQTDFYGLQRLIADGWHRDGEAFVHLTTVPLFNATTRKGDRGRQLTTAVELIEPERVDSPGGADSATRRAGVELGARGQATGYHVRKGHPDDPHQIADAEDYDLVKRWNGERRSMMHVYRRDRPGQTRGTPVLAPALSMFKHLQEYVNYEVVAARTTASIALFVTKKATADGPAPDFDETDEVYVEDVRPGGIEYLNEGEEIAPFVPNRPGTTFDPFLVRALRAIGAAVGLPYELFARDASKVNYTSSRTLLLEAYRGFRCSQAVIGHQACSPVRSAVLIEAYARGMLPTVKGFGDPATRAALLRHVWVPPARGWVDPVKEVQASVDAIAANLSTQTEETAGSGRDFADVAHQRARELRLLLDLEERHDLPPGSLTNGLGAPAPVAVAPPAPAEEPEEDDEAEVDEDQDTEDAENETAAEPQEAN